MKPVTPGESALLDWEVATRPAAGQVVCGDRHLVKRLGHGVLLAVVDGVGHGDEATAAAQAAIDVLEKRAREPLISMFKRCHEVLARTRGVVMTVALLDTCENSITWLGVGNVQAHLFRADKQARRPTESVLLRGGLVGYQLPPLQTNVVPLVPGDLLVFATDGIRSGFADRLYPSEAARRLVDHILNLHFKGDDDALVLAARYLGTPHD